MGELTVTLLGQFRLTHRGELVTAVDSARLQSLFAYLVLHRESPTLRQHLAFQFWQDATEGQAFTNLRKLIHKLRHSLPDADSFVAADSLNIWLCPDASVDLDVERFEAATGSSAGRQELELAAQLYAGDLLPACYDDWILPIRTELHERACVALGRLVYLLEESLEFETAIMYANQLLRLDPVQESTYRTLMRLHALNGDRAAALRVYHVCVTTLHEELAVPPSKTTHAQYQRLLADPPTESSAARVAGRLPLIGRQRSWSALLDAWRAAASGTPGCVVVLGEAGIGKSRLIEELTSWVSRQGFTIAVAHSNAAEGAPAYAPVIEWLQSPSLERHFRELAPPWLGELARLLPDLFRTFPELTKPPPLTAAWQRQHLFEALSRLFLRREQPLLLVLEDAQWSDAATLEWLHYLLRRDEQAPILLVITARSEELYGDHALHRLIHALRQTTTLTDINLEPLDDEDTARLACEAAASPVTPGALAAILHESEGYPLFVVELSRLTPPPGGLVEKSPQPSSPQHTIEMLPPRMNAVLQSRLAQLSPAAHDLAGLAAAIGCGFTFSVLAVASGQDEDTLVRNLDELWQRKILRERGADAYDFSHGKLREVAYGSLSAVRRRSLHRRIAHALAADPGTGSDTAAGAAAAHYELAGDYALAALYCRRAAAAAARMYANEDAIRLYQRAISLRQSVSSPQSPDQLDDADLRDLYVHLAGILHIAVRYDEARIAYEQALAHSSAAGALDRSHLLCAVANTWREQYQYGEALAGYQEALATLGSVLPVPDGCEQAYWQQWIQIHLEIGLVHYWKNEVDEQEVVNAALEEVIGRCGTASQRAVYWQRKGSVELRRNRCVSTDEITRWTQMALDALLEGGNAAALPAAHFMLGFHLLWNGRVHDAVTSLSVAQAAATQTGDVSLQVRSLTYLAIAYRQLEMAELVRQTVDKCLDVASAAHMPEYVGAAYANASWLAWREGDWQMVEQHASKAFAAWSLLPRDHASLAFQWTCLLPLLAAMIRTAQRIEEAVECARRLLDPIQQRLPDQLAAAAEGAVQAWEKSAPDQALMQCERLVELARTHRYL